MTGVGCATALPPVQSVRCCPPTVDEESSVTMSRLNNRSELAEPVVCSGVRTKQMIGQSDQVSVAPTEARTPTEWHVLSRTAAASVASRFLPDIPLAARQVRS